jgi:hypothetical protein
LQDSRDKIICSYLQKVIKMASSKPVWEKPRPKSLGKPKPLSPQKKSAAKARAKAAGRPYPNLVDNMAMAKKRSK